MATKRYQYLYRYGLKLERPVYIDGSMVTNDRVRSFIAMLLRKALDNTIPDRAWFGTQSGNCTVYIMRRSDTAMQSVRHRYHVVIWHGMETYCTGFTEAQAEFYIKHGRQSTD